MNYQQELERLYKKFGKLVPQVIVDEARDRDNPLHDYFEWNDAAAGEQYRLDQARQLIRRVKVTFIDGDDRPQQIRAFISVPSNGGRVYRHVDHVVDNPFQLKLLLAQMERDWKGMLTRYGQYDQFWEIVQRGIEETGDDL